MTDGPSGAQDSVLAEALDWVLKTKASPNDPKIRSQLTEWLARSETHVRAHRKALRVWQLTGDVAPAHPWALASVSAIRPAVEKRERRWRWPLGRRLSTVFAGAICGLCVIFLGALSWLGPRADYETAVGQNRRVELADGSVVILGGGSGLHIDFSEKRRNVQLLRGEAFFQVAHEEGRPFSVKADDMIARDIGTAFDVSMDPDMLRVAVQSGSVAVSYGSASLSSPEHTLAIGENLSIDRHSGRATRGQISAETIGGWRTGRLVAQNIPVGEVVQHLRRYFKGYIWVTDPALMDLRISGVFDLGRPDEALRAVVEPHAAKVTEVTPFILLVSRR